MSARAKCCKLDRMRKAVECMKMQLTAAVSALNSCIGGAQFSFPGRFVDGLAALLITLQMRRRRRPHWLSVFTGRPCAFASSPLFRANPSSGAFAKFSADKLGYTTLLSVHSGFSKKRCRHSIDCFPAPRFLAPCAEWHVCSTSN